MEGQDAGAATMNVKTTQEMWNLLEATPYNDLRRWKFCMCVHQFELDYREICRKGRPTDEQRSACDAAWIDWFNTLFTKYPDTLICPADDAEYKAINDEMKTLQPAKVVYPL